MDTTDIKCSKVIPFTGLLSPSPLLNNLHKTAKLEIPEVNDHRKSLGNIFNRLGINNIQSLILDNPKLNSVVLREEANTFFTSSYYRKAEELVRTMSMPNYQFENGSNEITKSATPVINPMQKEIIEQIKAKEQISQQRSNDVTKENSNNQEQGFGSFF